MKLEDPRRETIAWALARGKTQAEAARDASVDRSSVVRWTREEPVQRRIDELKMAALEDGDDGEDTRRGLARLVPLAETVVELSLKGEPYNGKPITAQQHQNALRTIELAHKLEPREVAGPDGAPKLGELIALADRRRSEA